VLAGSALQFFRWPTLTNSMQTTEPRVAENNNTASLSSLSQSTATSNSFVRFFVSVWTRIKFLFTSAFSEACQCTHHPTPLNRSQNASVTLPLRENEIHSNQVKLIKAETKEQINSEAPNSCLNRNINNNVVCETYYTESPKDEFTALPEFCAPPQDMSLSVIFLDEDPEIATEIPLTYSLHEGDQVERAISEQPVLIHEPKYLVPTKAKITHLEHSFINFVRSESQVEFNCSPEESLCSSSEIADPCRPPALTVLGRLYTQLMNGQISPEEHSQFSNTVVISTIPRNLSDCLETPPSLKPGQLYSWERVNSSGMDLSSERPKKYFIDPECFIDCLISDALEFINEVSPPQPEVPDIDEDDDTHHCFEFSTQFTDDVAKTRSDNLQPPLNLLIDTNNPSISIESPLSDSALCNQPESPKRNVPYKISACSMDSYMMRSERSSSLKSDHSPCSHKIVRFADAIGLDLESVRQVFDADNPPSIPASAIVDLNLDVEKSFGSIGAKQFQICFPQPGASGNFIHNVLFSAVCLENARIDSPRGVLTGTIRVKSFGVEKRVTLRITYNEWATFCEIPACYVQGSHDGSTDRFSFCAVFPTSMVAGDKVLFAIRYEALSTGEVFWDSNHGENYVISCHAKATDMAGDGSWVHFI